MPHDRFYTPQELQQGSTVKLHDEEQHHLRVMRKKEGDVVEIVNGKGVLAEGKIHTSNAVSIEKVIQLPSHPVELTLALALTLPAHLEWAIEKGTELGVAQFLLFPGDKSQKKELSDNQKLRLEKITIAAMKQSGRGILPNIVMFPPIKKWDKFEFPLFFGDIELAESITPPNKGKMVFAVGPEAGWSEPEREKLKQLGHPFSLNQNILRAETAAIVAAALLLR